MWDLVIRAGSTERVMFKPRYVKVRVCGFLGLNGPGRVNSESKALERRCQRREARMRPEE